MIAISWAAQQRLYRTWRRLDTERGMRRTIVAVAVARELAGFCRAAANAATAATLDPRPRALTTKTGPAAEKDPRISV